MDTSYIQKSTGFSEGIVNAVIDSFIKFIQLELRSGNEVKIPDFGVFYSKELPERQSRNPRTGESIIAKPKTKPKFRFYDSFEKMIQDNPQVFNQPDSQPLPSLKQTAPPPVPPIPPVPPVPSKTWHIASSDGKTEKALQSELKDKITPDTLVWSEGMEGWKAAKDVAELSYLLQAA
ncbi:HU family DNA-binding protein [Lyngbya sp. PCC 8106]|uniref:HU family DNA-binding protein n=1 Tax=Lyngbya sp. (strain PCC 8106) TaxID=313612 RepID=UPI0000EA98DF|nr:HU family DNA-binding protein [Lyngbya sp. PCC 8106]EAW35138.1 Histone-like DNA-binding protein [Lyngbya sp. PCC 8106]